MADPGPHETGDLELYKFAIEEGIRSLEHQGSELNRIRDRTINLFGLTATASAFLIGAALQSQTRGLSFYLPLAVGTALFALLAGLGWMTLKPCQWRAKVSSEVIVEDFAGSASADQYQQLAGFYTEAFRFNEQQLGSLRLRLRWSLLTSAGLVTTWIALVWMVA
ncbi:MAG: hypothetical protein AAGA65_19765 [Actinomycetota bacterium]